MELAHWTHNGGSLDYPLRVSCFASVSEAWPMIEQFQQRQTAFNILCRQGQYRHSSWTGGFAWSKIMGRITLGKQEDLSGLSGPDIEAEFQRLML